MNQDYLTRRDFLTATAGTAGGLLVGCAVPPQTESQPTVAAAPPAAPGKFGVYLEITPDNRAHIVCPQSEMGQGVYDSLTRIVADELDADWDLVEIRAPFGDDGFISPISKRHRTANSESVMVYHALLRNVGAAAREMLVAAAAAHWAVPVADCATRDSRVMHTPSGRSANYGDLAAAAAALAVPQSPRQKTAAEYRYIGKTLPHKATPAKCDGSAVFGIDVRVPNMLYAALARSPAVAAKVVSFDATAARALPGVVEIFEVSDGVAVVANTTWTARKAADALKVQYDDSASRGVDHEAIRKRMRSALDDDAAALPARRFGPGPAYDRAATEAALAAAPRRAEFYYEVPFLAHAALEPLNCTVLVDGDRCQAWVPTQQPDRAREVLAQIAAVPRENVQLSVTLLGGGFGRKWELDFVRQGAEIAKRMSGRPVKLTWTREQDFQHDRYRPAYRVRTRVGFDAAGKVLAIASRTTGVDMWKYQGRAPQGGSGDPFATGVLINERYGFPNSYVDFVPSDYPIPVGTWRSVSASMNGFFCESAIDDIAALLKRDPYQYRRELLAKQPRSLRVLEEAASKAGWGTPLPKGHGRGIAVTMGFESLCAQVIEVAVTGKAVKVMRIVCAFDCGPVIDPLGLTAQVEGGIVWGLSAARDGQIRFERGAARETNFHLGPIARIGDIPPIELHIVPSGEKLGGAGEASVPPVAPALANAIFAATGQRPRRLPIIESGFTLA